MFSCLLFKVGMFTRFLKKSSKSHYLVFSFLILLLGFMKTFFQTRENGSKPLIQNTLRINLQEGDPHSLHPHKGLVRNSRILGNALFERLVRIDENGLPELAAAEKMEISPDQKTYIFTIRPHLWSNGKPVTAYHFESAWKKALTPNYPCPRVFLFYLIKNAKAANKGKISMEQVGITVFDEKTLVVELEHPNPFFPDLLAHFVFSPLFDLENATTIVNGPFQLEDWQHDSSLKLKRNPLYWDADSIQLSEIVFSMVKDPSAAFALFEKGKIDWIGNPFSGLPADILSHECNRQPFQYKEAAGTYWIHMNTEKVPFTSAKIRKALSYVINRKSLTDNILIAQTPHKSPVPKNLSLLEEADYYSDTDLVTASELFKEGLEELGLTIETCPPLLLTHSHLPGQKTLAEALQQIWQEAFGIPVVLQGCDWKTFIAQMHERQMDLGGSIRFSMCSDPLYVLEMFKKEHP